MRAMEIILNNLVLEQVLEQVLNSELTSVKGFG